LIEAALERSLEASGHLLDAIWKRRCQAAHEILMSLKCGIVGLPNVGKSTLFNALTKAGIAAENYPFCTIDPNIGIVEVPDRASQNLPP